jgi:uncharacterized protein YdeI (YjbR/CyaY-like superfamily)
LLVGFYKVGSDRLSISWPESVDQTLCFGWIDGVRTSIDSESYKIRFTKRKPDSIWSAVNIKKVEELTQKGLMQAAGFNSFAKRKEENSKIYSYEKNDVVFPKEYENEFKANKKAWRYFQNLAPGYLKASIHWVISAKQEATRKKRLEELIKDCEEGTNQWKNNKYKK